MIPKIRMHSVLSIRENTGVSERPDGCPAGQATAEQSLEKQNKSPICFVFPIGFPGEIERVVGGQKWLTGAFGYRRKGDSWEYPSQLVTIF